MAGSATVTMLIATVAMQVPEIDRKNGRGFAGQGYAACRELLDTAAQIRID